MKKFNFVIILIGIVFIQSCAIGKKTTEAMESWEHYHISRVIQSWGPATQTSSDGQGGTIYTWVSSSTGAAYIDSNGVYQPPRTSSCSQSFYVNSSGIIYHWAWQGNCR